MKRQKLRETGVPLALDCRHLKGGHNNQMKVGDGLREGVLVRRRDQGGTYGGVHSLRTGRQIEGERKQKNKIRHGHKVAAGQWNYMTTNQRSATVGERRGGMHLIVLGQTSWEGG